MLGANPDTSFGGAAVGGSMTLEANTFEALVVRLRSETGAATPHSLADQLRLPDGGPAPEVLRVWTTFDNRYPTYLSCRRSEQAIADAKGVVIAQPMSSVLRWVCLDSIRDEIEDDDETVAYLEELIESFTGEFPGYGVYLEPQESPDRVLWFGPGRGATVLWYQDDEFERREAFEDYVLGVFEHD
jgi:hypothetical protein